MTGPWSYYYEQNGQRILYICPKCKKHSGYMKRREVSEPSGDSHNEYRIVCNNCDFAGSVHWSKLLAEKTWEAEGVIL